MGIWHIALVMVVPLLQPIWMFRKDMNRNFQNDSITYAITWLQPETHGCVLSMVAPDGLVLKHQAISIHSAD